MKPAEPDPPELHHALWGGTGGSDDYGFTGDVGYDIGANCGQTVPEMLSRFKVVYAFEPAEECAPWLDDIGDGRFSWLPIAVSCEDATVDLVEVPDKIETGQLVSAEAEGMEYDPRRPDAGLRKVICRTIDTLVNRGEVPSPDFMKIDVEGHELKVLRGAEATLVIKAPAILLEFHSKDLHRACVDLLDGYGYTTRTVRHPHYYPGTELWYAHGWVRAHK